MSTRPQPRPRPRPRPKVAAVDTPGEPISSGNFGVQNDPASTTQPVVIDDDERFMKHRGDAWKKLDQLAKSSASAQKRQSSSESDDGSGADVVSHKKKKYKKQVKKDKDAQPDWTKHPDAIVVSSDDDLDGAVLRNVENVRQSGGRNNPSLGSASRQRRSRSRSITPPPEISPATILYVKEAVGRLLSPPIRSSSPDLDFIDDTEDSIVLDPELAKIVRKAEIEVRRQASATPAPGRSPSPADIGGPEIVSLRVTWKPHPLKTHDKPQLMEFTMKRNEAFRQLFDECADSVSIPVNSLIVSFESKRIYPSASPHGIGVWAEADLEACDKVTYEYLRTRRHATPGLDDIFPRNHIPLGVTPPLASQLEQESVAASDADDDDDDDDTIKLTFRSGVAKDVILKVRRTTKCSVILKAYLKKAGLGDKYSATPKKKGKSASPALAVDGDRLDPDSEIGDADLEDGDQVEVVGL